jgi:NitT/TauT family transport system ATP-binding protein
MTEVQEALRNVPPGKLVVEGVTKTFHSRRSGMTQAFRHEHSAVTALDDVSLQVAEGEFVCLVGASGCGKSTLLNIIAGLDMPDRGRVLADGKPVTGPGRDRMLMFQEPALFPWLDALGNVIFGLNLKPNLRRKERRDVAMFYLKLVGLEKFARSNIHELSGGMKQRVALARALAPNPGVILMDEPFGALDALTREQLYGDLQRIWAERRKTIVFVTHNVREAVCLGNRVVLFSPHPGRIRRQYKIGLPRPRDINSVDLAEHATEIVGTLREYLVPETAEATS